MSAYNILGNSLDCTRGVDVGCKRGKSPSQFLKGDTLFLFGAYEVALDVTL